MSTITNKELAVRVVTLTVPETGTYLVKSASPGRLYDPITPAQLAAQISGLLPASAVVNGLQKDKKTFELTSTDITAGFVSVPNAIVLHTDWVIWNGSVLDNDPVLSGDYYISGNKVMFGTELKTVLSIGDKIVVRYEYVI